jgi:integrase
VRQSDKNYDWLFALFQALMTEYTYRYGKVHACSKLELHLARIPENMPWAPFTEPTPAMPDDVKVLKEVYTDRYQLDSLASYRNYYIQNKTHLANWKNREVPEWFTTK